MSVRVEITQTGKAKFLHINILKSEIIFGVEIRRGSTLVYLLPAVLHS